MESIPAPGKRNRYVKKNGKYFNDQFVNNVPDQIKTPEIKSGVSKRKCTERRKPTNKRQKQEENIKFSDKDKVTSIKKDSAESGIDPQNKVIVLEQKSIESIVIDINTVPVVDDKVAADVSPSDLKTIANNESSSSHHQAHDIVKTAENNMEDEMSITKKQKFTANLDLLATNSKPLSSTDSESQQSDSDQKPQMSSSTSQHEGKFSKKARNMVEDMWGKSNPSDEVCIFCDTKIGHACYKQHVIEEQDKLRVHDGPDKKTMFRCCKDGCEVLSSSRRELNLHVRKCQPCKQVDSKGKCLPEKRYRCRECGYRASVRGVVLHHTVKHTGERPFKCSQCPLKWKFLIQCQAHERTHTGEKRHKCSTCHEAFYTRDELEAHIPEHTGVLLYQCGICKKRFSMKKRLARHYKTIHDTSQVYKCKNCEETFTNYNEFVKHKNSHEGKIICDRCGAMFTSKGTLRRHISTIHEADHKSRFECEICLLNFTQRASLTRHQKIYAKRSAREHIDAGKMVKNLQKRSFDRKPKPLGFQLQSIPESFPNQITRTNFQAITKEIISIMEPSMTTVCLSIQGQNNDDVTNVMIKIGKITEDGLRYVFLVFPDNTPIETQNLFTDMLEKQPKLLQELDNFSLDCQDSDSYTTILIKQPLKPTEEEHIEDSHKPVDPICPPTETKGNIIEKSVSEILEKSVSELSKEKDKSDHELVNEMTTKDNPEQLVSDTCDGTSAEHLLKQVIVSTRNSDLERLQKKFQEKYANLISVMDSTGSPSICPPSKTKGNIIEKSVSEILEKPASELSKEKDKSDHELVNEMTTKDNPEQLVSDTCDGTSAEHLLKQLIVSTRNSDLERLQKEFQEKYANLISVVDSTGSPSICPPSKTKGNIIEKSVSEILEKPASELPKEKEKSDHELVNEMTTKDNPEQLVSDTCDGTSAEHLLKQLIVSTRNSDVERLQKEFQEKFANSISVMDSSGFIE